METKAKKYYSGEWNYNDYTPDWVKDRIQKRYGIEIATMDQADHPLNKERMPYNVNTVYQYFRHPEYPFWVCDRDIDKAMLSCFEANEEMSKEDFLEILKDRAKPVYLYFCQRWYSTTSGDCYNELRKSLIEASKGM